MHRSSTEKNFFYDMMTKETVIHCHIVLDGRIIYGDIQLLFR